MKNTPLSNLRKKHAAYFRRIGVVQAGRYTRRSRIEYIVQRSYDALPKKLKQYIDDPEQAIQVTTNLIMQSGSEGQVNPYEALRQVAVYRQKKSGDNTRAYIWARFRSEQPSVYAKFNSYMYRQGYSASGYWFDNVALSQEGSHIEAICELPAKASGVAYFVLEIEYDFSGHELDAYLY